LANGPFDQITELRSLTGDLSTFCPDAFLHGYFGLAFSKRQMPKPNITTYHNSTQRAP